MIAAQREDERQVLDRNRDVGMVRLARGTNPDRFASRRDRGGKIVHRGEIAREVDEQAGEPVRIGTGPHRGERLANDRNRSLRLHLARVRPPRGSIAATCSPLTFPSERCSLRSCSNMRAAVSRSPRNWLKSARVSSKRNAKGSRGHRHRFGFANARSASSNRCRNVAVLAYRCSARASDEASPLARACSTACVASSNARTLWPDSRSKSTTRLTAERAAATGPPGAPRDTPRTVPCLPPRVRWPANSRQCWRATRRRR